MSDNVYKRLASARVALQSVKLKQSGNNTFAKYTYFDLTDFLPHVNAICEKHGICGVVSFASDAASLTIVNCDSPEDRVVFSSPMAKAELKGCHDIQNLGAVQSYLRRYLWMAAFEIVEHDALDATTGEPPKCKPQDQPSNKPAPTPEQSAFNSWVGPLVKAGTLSREEVAAVLKSCNGNYIATKAKLEEAIAAAVE